jgi:hypothetical protein
MKNQNFILAITVAAVTVVTIPTSLAAQDAARAAKKAIKVDCNKGGSISATLAHLALTGSTRGITILVSGTCKENISISRFDRLILQASPRATLQDASNGNAAVVNIVSSSDVTLQGFYR